MISILLARCNAFLRSLADGNGVFAKTVVTVVEKKPSSLSLATVYCGFHRSCDTPKKVTFFQEKTNLCATVAVRVWFGPAPHIRGAHTHAVPAVVRLTS